MVSIVGIMTTVYSMKLFQAADVIELTGLTRSQLREWSSPARRNLVPADIEPHGPGRHALYTWQTILVLRLLRELHVDFAVEIGAWAPGMVGFRQKLERVSFLSLWGSLVHFQNRDNPELVPLRTGALLSGVVMPLDPHLLPIATKLSLRTGDQLLLFPAVSGAL